ncbi:T9SS type A sorting domain-containing protein [Chryseobacterium antibioticum]|uniref:T9SS type A sorting domain-containing protein n=1 Tax=Chryseobacterium pyrolae TaxID=2987481 RepID=A0ABT2IMV9_9FLAO|nr:T9SS type A sorting domain-containing protein [Chryseobacterium pyrolae]MCT2409968.1 T9SS type A sorting domain-containing protein [Chryseobacterium pyrolae]
MKKNYLSAIFLCTSLGLSYAQVTEVYFKYDEAGNQRYRGPDSAAKQASDQSKTASLSRSQVMDEKTFWKQIRLYPVPVNDVLTIDWTEEVDGLIESVSLYQHSTVHWKFQQQNLPNLNKQIKINMTGYDWGVYVLRFTLTDGRIFSKNITKR